ncbi:MAG: NlpC/P60 family protein [Erysipelotrichia bacterium]|nr:NlpC/P60 family protein [Erysipelotrichia bacterium]
MHFNKQTIEKITHFMNEKAENIKSKTVTLIQKVSEQAKAIHSSNKEETSVLSNVHFNFHHLVSVIIVAVFAFLVTFYSTGYNTKEVSAAGLDKPKSIVFNQKAIDVEYGDTKAVALLAKEILKKEVSAVSNLETISNGVGTGVYTLENYVISVTLENIALGESKAILKIEDKTTYGKNEYEKVSISTDKELNIHTGSQYTYEVALNVIDKQAPTITLKQSEVEIKDDETFNIADYIESVVDNVEGSVAYRVEGEIAKDDEQYVAGEYTLQIFASDASGNESNAQMKVKVEKTETKAEIAATNLVYGSYAESAYAGSVVAEARAQIGKAYVFGGSGPSAFDCSGLIHYVYARSGVAVPRTSGGQASVGVAIDPNDASQWRAGDIVTFGAGGNAHAAIYSGNGTLIHALNPSAGIKETGIYGFGSIYSVRRVQ